ncbi:MAG TPA: hypothetical protein EYN58_04265 [Candidatus Poseidoniales archaeon]|nr:MAG: hypothetical protein CXX81_29445 [Euryarchaeota archaeon]HHZ74384.1 hypothetical protein [Candidatus Poseidoniales archaeon]PXY74806.1 MAG: hypothetical protein CXX81_20350 [Euryarchaeota archaeon]PXY77910.1 MAG: hypothetical protein CXX81_10515 [Euryarchaeota archaeon]PXY78631.1 MAG: hypothetical protein CXX81_06810 [Euryarchaeota archaeon]
MQSIPPHQGVPPPQQIIGGQVAQGGITQTPYGQPVVYAGQPSQAAKVIGILLMIYGGFAVISGIVTAAGMSYFNSYMSDMAGEDISGYLPPTWIYILQGLVASIAGVAYLYSGWLIQSFKKKGFWIAWAALGLTYIMNIVVAAATPYPSDIYGDEAEFTRMMGIGAAAVGGLCGTAFCGVILAIPLFITNNGME